MNEVRQGPTPRVTVLTRCPLRGSSRRCLSARQMARCCRDTHTLLPDERSRVATPQISFRASVPPCSQIRLSTLLSRRPTFQERPSFRSGDARVNGISAKIEIYRATKVKICD